MKKEITILTTWKGIVYELDGSISDYFKLKEQNIEKGIDGFWSNKYTKRLKYASFEDEGGKTQYLSIEAPKNEPTQAEKDKSAVILRELAKKAEVNKLARFIEKRNDILERLRLEEVRLGEMTTVDKIECYNKYKLTK